MEHESNGNGAATGQVYVKFGPKETQEIPLEWAELMLSELFRSNAPTFGRLLQAAAGVPPRTR